MQKTEGTLVVDEAAQEDAIAIAKVPAFIGRRYGVPRPHQSTVIRWTQRGVSGITLRVFALGGRKYVRPSEIESFMQRVNGLPAKPNAAA